jgi:hypothetical protein
MNDRVYHPLALAFHRARLGALHATIDELIRRRPTSLLASRDGWTHPRIRARIDRGVTSVPIYQIISRAARYDDFNQLAPPAERYWQPRRISHASERRHAHQPPIELYRVDASYFVKDGNRRVTEARARGQLFLLARVTECLIDEPIDDTDDVIAQLLLDEYHEFQADTELAQLRPDQRVECTALGGYADVVHQIEANRASLEASLNHTVERRTAVTSWYDTVYVPIADAIRRQGVLDMFPGRSETDLYLWAASRSMRQDGLALVSKSPHVDSAESILQIIADLQYPIRS